MSKIWLIMILVVVLIGGIVFFNKQQTNAPSDNFSISPTATPTASVTSSISSAPSNTSVGTGAKTYKITYKNGTIDINTLTIKKGDSVLFINNDSTPHWPASGPHPAHTTCLGFDPLKLVNAGESYSRVFSEAKTCPFHDHINPGNANLRGQIIVTQ